MKEDILSGNSRRFWIPVIVILALCIPNLLSTGTYILMDSPTPLEGLEAAPHAGEPLAEKFMFIVLDGVRRDILLNEEYMPNLNDKKDGGATLLLETGPLTMTGACVREMATGVQSRPSEGLANFHPEHPGTEDGWTIASTYDGDGDDDPDRRLGIVGDYVWGDLYEDNPAISFSQHFHGHSDYYQGDDEAFATLTDWLTGNSPLDRDLDSIIMHLSGTDHVAHRYKVIGSPEYLDKMNSIDDDLGKILDLLGPEWTVAVTSDHGATNDGRHGSPDSEIREIAAVIYGPNIKVGAVVEGMSQRDLATLPSLLFAQPLSHSINGRMPLEMLDISQAQKDELELWNWHAAYERNEWLQENDWPAVEGLDREVISWELIPEDEMGIKSDNMVVALISFLAGGVFVYWWLRKENSVSDSIKQTSLIISAIGAGALLMASYYIEGYPSGLITIVGIYFFMAFIGTSVWMYRSSKDGKNWHQTLWLFSCIFFIAYLSTRFSMLGFFAFVLCLYTLYKNKKYEKMEKIALVSLAVALIFPVFLTHYRLMGFNLPRNMLSGMYPDTLVLAIAGCAMIGLVSFLAISIRSNAFQKKNSFYASAYAILPLLMYFQSNYIDWFVMISLVGIASVGIRNFLQDGEDKLRLLEFSALAWLTISWGAWPASFAILILCCSERLLSQHAASLLKPVEYRLAEYSRILILALLPIAVWFTIWSAMGQISGITNPRELDLGELFLRGGYIGDRLSPSNGWVAFMGSGPLFLIPLLVWRIFQRHDWPLHLTLGVWALRITAIWMTLSFAANQPRTIFKGTWDTMFSFSLLLTMIPFIYFLYRDSQNVESVND